MMSEEKAKEDMLLWMDVETTGLDPRTMTGSSRWKCVAPT